MGVIELKVDTEKCSPTMSFPLLKFRFLKFNPVQSAFLQVVNSDMNVVVESKTSSGKTTVAEMSIAADALSKGKSAIFLAPLKALAQEKIDDWTDRAHSFSGKKIVIATGDYAVGDKREKLLQDASSGDIILMTTELFDSLTRRPDRVSRLFSSCGTLIVDEAHLLTMPDRGSALEVALMRFSQISKAKIVLLSATMSNSKDLAGWLTHLNGRDSALIKSDWRPCKLDVEFVSYMGGSWKEQQKNLIAEVFNTLGMHPDDKFIVFVHSKSFGRQLTELLCHRGYRAAFHNADISKTERSKYVEMFKKRRSEDRESLEILVATSTLAYGLNLPARRVIVAGVQRGTEDVSPLDITQMIGRAGRVGIDPKGDAHILIPHSKFTHYTSAIKVLAPVESQLIKEEQLAFHLINEINEGINTGVALGKWFERSFAAFDWPDREGKVEHITNTLAKLLDFGAIRIQDLDKSKGEYFEVTPIGKIASWFYYSPFMVALLYNGFYKASKLGNAVNEDDLLLSWILGRAGEPVPFSTPSPIYKDFQERMELRLKALAFSDNINIGKVSKLNIAMPFAFWLRLTEQTHHVPEATSLTRAVQMDAERLTSMLSILSSFYQKDVLVDTKLLESRLKHGIRKELSSLVTVANIDGARARKLFAAGFRTANEVYAKAEKASKVAGVPIRMKMSKPVPVKAAPAFTSKP